jgi:hypothetical protein
MANATLWPMQLILKTERGRKRRKNYTPSSGSFFATSALFCGQSLGFYPPEASRDRPVKFQSIKSLLPMAVRLVHVPASFCSA